MTKILLLIHDCLARFICKYTKKSNPLLKMAGIGKSSTGKVSENIDEIYLED